MDVGRRHFCAPLVKLFKSANSLLNSNYPELKMTVRISAGIFIFLILLSHEAFGDAAPDPGFKRISLNLKLETPDDLSDFRFFIKSGADVEEVFVKRGEQTIVSPLGGGAYYSAGKLLAVPKKDLVSLTDSPGDGKLTGLQKAIYEGRVPGTLELVDHLFSRTVNESEAGNFQDPIYRIERDSQAGIKAVHVSGGATTSVADKRMSSGRLFWQGAAAAVVAGIFLLFGIATLGILYFRKKAKAI